MSLLGWVDGEEPKPTSIRFWYCNDHESSLNSVQSAFLWGYTRLHAWDQRLRGMPELTPADVGNLRKVEYLGLLAETEEEIRQARASLVAAGVSSTLVRERQYSGTVIKVYFALLKIL